MKIASGTLGPFSISTAGRSGLRLQDFHQLKKINSILRDHEDDFIGEVIQSSLAVIGEFEQLGRVSTGHDWGDQSVTQIPEQS